MGKFLVSYDISEEQRREKVRKISKSTGQHHQFSVFLIDAPSFQDIDEKLKEFIKEEVDRLVIAKIKGKIHYLGKPYESFKWSI